MNLTDKIEAILVEPLAAKGYGLVRIKVSGVEKRVLQLMIERHDEQEITIEDCVAVSRQSSLLLDVDDPLPFAYTLEVSSPGMDRPLVKPKDYMRFKGNAVKIHTNVTVEGRKKFVAFLKDANEENITLEFEDNSNIKTIVVPYHDISSTKLYIDFNNLK